MLLSSVDRGLLVTVMGKLKRKIRGARRARSFNAKQSFCLFVITGLLHDILWIINSVIHVIAWPIHALAAMLAREAKRYPSLRLIHKHAHAYFAVFIGLAVVILSFLGEGMFHHAVWSASLETARAAGVCPIWDLISGFAHVGADFEA